MAKIFNCFEIKNETEKKADLYFYGDIVSDWYGAWADEDQYPDAVKNFLTAQDGKDINIYINSAGGSVFAGLAIYNMIHRHALKNRVQVTVDGLAGSIASVIAFAGDVPPRIPSNAFLMIHNPWVSIAGNAGELRKQADDLDDIAVGMRNVYMKHIKEGITEADIISLMEKETWLNGADASNYFNVEVTDAVEIAAYAGDYINRAQSIPEALKAKAPEAISPEKKEEMLKEVRNALKRSYIQSLC